MELNDTVWGDQQNSGQTRLMTENAGIIFKQTARGS